MDHATTLSTNQANTQPTNPSQPEEDNMSSDLSSQCDLEEDYMSTVATPQFNPEEQPEEQPEEELEEEAEMPLGGVVLCSGCFEQTCVCKPHQENILVKNILLCPGCGERSHGPCHHFKCLLCRAKNDHPTSKCHLLKELPPPDYWNPNGPPDLSMPDKPLKIGCCNCGRMGDHFHDTCPEKASSSQVAVEKKPQLEGE